MPEKPKVYIQTFYGFDVFVNGRVIYFPSKKSKELLAILVNQRGGSVSLAQVVHILYENLKESSQEKYQSGLSPAAKDAGGIWM